MRRVFERMAMNDEGHVSDQLFHILLTLVDEPRHGYGIIREVERRTGGAVVLGSSTLYSAIKRVRLRGWIDEVPAPHEADPRRRYYALTESGRSVVRAEAARLQILVDHARAKGMVPAPA
jgi:DNA-binding PadR family transcriptional regulator